MISLILAKKIFSMFLMIFCGFLLVKLRVLKPEDSRPMSVMMLYLVMPCGVFSAFIVDFSPQICRGLLLAIAASILIHVWMIIFTKLAAGPFHLDGVEQAAVIYSNAGNLILPIVSSILGSEWTIYTIGYLIVQTCLLWSHAKKTICGERGIDVKKIVTNINMITIYFGIVMFFTGLRFPAPVHDAISSVGAMLGPLAMVITGMLLGGIDVHRLLSYRRIWLITLFRLVICPLGSVALIKYSGIARLIPQGETVLLVTLLACMSPMASTVTQFAQVYDRNADYASAINVVTTALCIVTMPLLVAFYQM